MARKRTPIKRDAEYKCRSTVFRGLGLGKQLMDQFIGYMHDYGYRRAFLWTTNEQQAAISLYKCYGFCLTEEKESNAFGKTLFEQRYDLDLT
jgi:peptidyl-dipeptidase Dcp